MGEGMSEHLSANNAELYYQHQLPASELIEADAHISSCATCQQYLRALENTEGAVEQLRTGLELEAAQEEEHPAHAQFTAYAENQLDDVDREIMDSHLEICSQCGEVMQDLKMFMATAAPEPIVEVRAAESYSFRERLLAFWRSHTEWMSLQYAGALATILLLA